ncbi:Nif11-like leader peptide family natural product precursor [Myxococcus sp. Y35]|uniref:Nif11-like leader peptide family natural product precursor n=1 Tax=Pseudomyxococcus flavus TaxID=3115648 RepID=UPI003CF17A29
MSFFPRLAILVALLTQSVALNAHGQPLQCNSTTLWPNNVGTQPTWTDGESTFGPTVRCCGPGSTPNGIQNTELSRTAAQAYCAARNVPWYSFNVRVSEGHPYLDITCCRPPGQSSEISLNVLTFMNALMQNGQLRDRFSNSESLASVIATAQASGYPITEDDIPAAVSSSTASRVLAACGGQGEVPCTKCTKSVTVYFPLNFCCVPLSTECVQSSYACNSGLSVNPLGVCVAPAPAPPPATTATVSWWDGTPAADVTVVLGTSVYVTNAQGQFTLKKSDSPAPNITLRLANEGIRAFTVETGSTIISPQLVATRGTGTQLTYVGTPPSPGEVLDWQKWRSLFSQVSRAAAYLKAQAPPGVTIRPVGLVVSSGGQKYVPQEDNLRIAVPEGKVVSLPDTVVFHEYGHKAMVEMYGKFDHLLGSACGKNNGIGYAVDPTCAFVEGWAHFFAMAALNITRFGDRWGGSEDLENYPANKRSLSDEGRVAAALLDVYDNRDDSCCGDALYSDGNDGVSMQHMLMNLKRLASVSQSLCVGKGCLSVVDYSGLFKPLTPEDGRAWLYNYVAPP